MNLFSSNFYFTQILGFIYLALGLALTFVGLKYKIGLTALSTGVLIAYNSIYYLGLQSWYAVATATIIFVAVSIAVKMTDTKYKTHILCIAYIAGFSIGIVVWTIVASYFSGKYVRMGFEITFGLTSVRFAHKNMPKDILGMILFVGSNMIACGISLLSGGFGVWPSFGVQIGCITVFSIIGKFIQRKLKLDKDDDKFFASSTLSQSEVNNI